MIIFFLIFTYSIELLSYSMKFFWIINLRSEVSWANLKLTKELLIGSHLWMGPMVLHEPPFSHRGKQQLRDGLSTLGVTQLSNCQQIYSQTYKTVNK